MRDYRKLKAFQLADELAVAVYEATREFPKSERFGLTAQLRRCAVSAPSNIVEGCSRHTRADYLRFLDIAYGSEHECKYQLSLACRLGYLAVETHQVLDAKADEATKVIAGLIRSLEGDRAYGT